MSLADRLRKMEDQARARARAPAPLPEPIVRTDVAERVAIPTDVVDAREAGVLVRTIRYALDASHGDVLLGAVHGIDRARVGAAGRLAIPLDLDNALFLDTETTSLEGGASSYVFLVGLARVHPDAIVVEQILLEAPEAEARFLELVAQRLRGCTQLVTFFGKAFDRHRLDERFAFQGGEEITKAMPHLDLYWVARRMFEPVLQNGRLRTLEERRLGVVRVRDLDGAECPDAWFDWITGVGRERLDRAITHNLHDVVSLVALLAHVDAQLARADDPRIAAGAGRLLLDVGACESAIPHLAHAMEALTRGAVLVPDAVRRAALAMADVHRKDGDVASAMRVLERLAQANEGDAEPVVVLMRLAKKLGGDASAVREYALEVRRRVAQSSAAGPKARKWVEDARVVIEGG